MRYKLPYTSFIYRVPTATLKPGRHRKLFIFDQGREMLRDLSQNEENLELAFKFNKISKPGILYLQYFLQPQTFGSHFNIVEI